MSNRDNPTVKSFGDEWERFDQTNLDPSERQRIFDDYFAIFPWDKLPPNAKGFDLGCGSGRWAKLVSPRVGELLCIDPSSALEVARRQLVDCPNVQFISADVSEVSLKPDTMDFGYSLGVLHHVPETANAISQCARWLKPGAPLLLYIYYAFDNRPWWFWLLWKISDLFRRFICRMPHNIKHLITDIIATCVYWPLARLSKLLQNIGCPVHGFPLSYYSNLSFYTMRTDARDRFGTPLEKRFTRGEIERMMLAAGLENIQFSKSAPYWCATGIKQ
jgi:ubiquinone/menaquinone biosynthesis C-methylase UbiE